MTEFVGFDKIPRLRRNCTITEKIDGTNSAVVVEETDSGTVVYAQSRTRVITPGKSTDNYGFAAWVEQNKETLARLLGQGRHFGEWWGVGINRGYNMRERRFSLFNTARWSKLEPTAQEELRSIGVHVVPVLYQGPFTDSAADNTLNELRSLGSAASLGFDKPEGIVIFHEAARSYFKVTLENDEAPKGVSTAANSMGAFAPPIY